MHRRNFITLLFLPFVAHLRKLIFGVPDPGVAPAPPLALEEEFWARAARAITTQQEFVINCFHGQIYTSDILDVQDTPVYDTIIYNAPSRPSRSKKKWQWNAAESKWHEVSVFGVDLPREKIA